MDRPLPMPVVRVASRSRTASRTLAGSFNSPLAASKFISSAMASFFCFDSSGTLILAALRISVKRMGFGSTGETVPFGNERKIVLPPAADGNSAILCRGTGRFFPFGQESQGKTGQHQEPEDPE